MEATSQAVWNSPLLSILAATVGLYVGLLVAFRKTARWQGSGRTLAWSLGIAAVTVGMGIVFLKLGQPPTHFLWSFMLGYHN